MHVFAAQSKNDDDGKYFRGNCSVPSYDNGVHIPPMEQWDNGKIYFNFFPYFILFMQFSLTILFS